MKHFASSYLIDTYSTMIANDFGEYGAKLCALEMLAEYHETMTVEQVTALKAFSAFWESLDALESQTFSKNRSIENAEI